MNRSTVAVLCVLVGVPACEAAPPPAAELCGAPHDPSTSPFALDHAVKRYAAPDVVLVDEDGDPVPLADALAGDGPVAMNFIFTTCTTICPIMSAAFAGLRGEPGVRLVSISIDPEHDRPRVLKSYAARFGPAPSWHFYTGTSEDIRTVLAAFDAQTGDKANHRPFSLVRRAGADGWTRLDGLPSARALRHELGMAP
jgi:protein SCO1/2